MNKQNRNRWIDTEREQIDGWQKRGGLRAGERGEGIKKYKLAVTKQLQGCKYSIRNIVDNIVITMYHARWALGLSGEIMS